MTKITIDMSAIKNEVAVIKNEAFNALNANDMERRNALGRIVEKLKTLQQRLSSDSTKVEIK
jgi:hypothetical protein